MFLIFLFGQVKMETLHNDVSNIYEHHYCLLCLDRFPDETNDPGHLVLIVSSTNEIHF